MTDAEWAALPVEIRIWAIDASIRQDPGMESLASRARRIASIVMKAPKPDASTDEPEKPRGWREERGLG